MDNSQIQIVLQLLVAIILGAVLGFEREYKKKEAGLQTYSLVTLGSCLFTVMSTAAFNNFSGMSSVAFDPSRIVLAVATGIGFIGGGVIIYRQFRIEGLTTAAGLWTAAAIGIAVGLKLYGVACVATVLAAIIFIFFGAIERKIFNKD